MPISNVYNIDCIEYMKTLPDKFFDLAIVDPPYGDALGGGVRDFASMQETDGTDTRRWQRFGQRFDRYKPVLPPPVQPLRRMVQQIHADRESIMPTEAASRDTTSTNYPPHEINQNRRHMVR